MELEFDDEFDEEFEDEFELELDEELDDEFEDEFDEEFEELLPANFSSPSSLLIVIGWLVAPMPGTAASADMTPSEAIAAPARVEMVKEVLDMWNFP